MTEHLDEGEFIRLIDGEYRADERAALEQHALTCPVCVRRLAEWRRVSSALTAALAAADVAPNTGAVRPLPRRFWRRRVSTLSAAAIVLLVVAGVAAAAPPVRTWLRARWAELRGTPTPPPRQESAAPQISSTTTVRFVPRAPVFAIELAARQDAGVLTVDVSEDTIATARLSGGSGAELVVLPMALRIVNRASTVASYDVRLPRGITEVTVHVGSGPTHRLVRLTDRRWTVDLKSTSLEPH